MYTFASVLGTVLLGSAVLLGSVDGDIPRKTPQPSCVQMASKKVGDNSKKKLTTKKNTLTKKVAIVAPGEVESLINKYAGQYGVDPNLMKKIGICESHFNPNAVNGQHRGMYQYATTTWISTRKQMGLDTNPDLRHNAEESIKTTAFKIANGGKNAWRECL